MLKIETAVAFADKHDTGLPAVSTESEGCKSMNSGMIVFLRKEILYFFIMNVTPYKANNPRKTSKHKLHATKILLKMLKVDIDFAFTFMRFLSELSL